MSFPKKIDEEFLGEEDEDEEGEEEEEEEDEEEPKVPFEGAYDPGEYDTLKVSGDVKNLFNYITAYTPQIADLDVKLRPFIPDYIPAVGDIDPFIKVPRPDGVDEGLGLRVLDEPQQVRDPALLKLQLRALGKDILVDGNDKSTEEIVKIAASNRDIDQWIENINHLHQETTRGGSAMTLIHSQRLPDLESLMQEWPPEVEEALDRFEIPPPDSDCDLEQYIDIVCGILDIPVHNSKITSLYLLFSLYNEFRNSQHFKQF